LTAKTASCYTSVTILTAELVEQIAPTALSQIYKNDEKLAASTGLVSKSSRQLIVVTESEATGVLIRIKSLLSTLERSSRKMSVTVA